MSRNLSVLLKNPRIFVTVIAGVFSGAVQALPLDTRQPEQLTPLHEGVVVKQGGEAVGLAWARGTDDPCVYTEFWYLTPGYEYPAPGSGRTVLRVMKNTPIIETRRQFFRFARSFLGQGKRIKMKVKEKEFCGADGFK